MTEQELREQFEKYDYTTNLLNMENYDIIEMYFKAGYKFAQETIDKQKKEIENLKQARKCMSCGELAMFPLGSKSLDESTETSSSIYIETIKSKDAEIERLESELGRVFVQLKGTAQKFVDKDKAIAEAMEIIVNLIQQYDSPMLNSEIELDEKAKAWVENNK